MTPRRAFVRIGVVAAAVAALVVATSGPAFAHASLVSSTPFQGQVLDQSPSNVTLRFNEPVEASNDAVRLFDANGERVAVSDPTQPQGDVVRTRVRDRLPAGGYVITWLVTSIDAHPIQGAFTFQVGSADSARGLDKLARELLAGRKASTGLGIAYGITRWTLFASLALLIGGAFAIAALWSECRSSDRARTVLTIAWSGAVLATIGGILTYGSYTAGGSLTDVLAAGRLGTTLGERYGEVALIRLGVLALAVPLVVLLTRRRPDGHLPRWWIVSAAAAALALAATPAFAGHASSGDLTTAAIVTDTIHVAAMALWLGGLLMILVVVRPRHEPVGLDVGLARFSALATGCVTALVVTGAFQAWRQVRSLTLLTDTEYGQLLIAKLVLVGVALVVAAKNRQIVQFLQRHRVARSRDPVPVIAGGADEPPARNAQAPRRARGITRSVGLESLLLALVLIVTALLVNAPPARTATPAQAAGPASLSLQSRRLWIDVTIDPARVGPNTIHLTALAIGGTLNDVTEMQATLDLPERRIGPLPLTLQRLTAGHYVATSATIPTPGEWRLTIRTLLTNTRQVTLVGRITVP